MMSKYLVVVILVINLIDPGAGNRYKPTTSTTTECPTTESESVTTTTEEYSSTTTEEYLSTTTDCETGSTTTEDSSTTTDCETESTTTEDSSTTTDCETASTTTEDSTTTTDCETGSTTTEDSSTTTDCETRLKTTEESTTTTDCETGSTTTEDSSTTTDCETGSTTMEESTTTTDCETGSTTTEDSSTTTDCETESTTTEDSSTTTDCETASTTTEDSTITTDCETGSTTTEESSTTTDCDTASTTTEESTTTTEESSTTTEESSTTEPDYPTCSPLKGCPCRSAFNRSVTVVWDQSMRSLYKLLVVDRTSPTLCRSQIAIYYLLVTVCKYATGITYDQCLNVLYLKSVNEMNCVIDIFNRYFTEIGTFTKYYKIALKDGIESARFTAEAAFVDTNSNVHRYTADFNSTCKKLIEIPVNANYKNIQQTVNTINNLTRQYSYNEDNIDMTFPNLADIIQGTSGRGLIQLSNLLFKSQWKKGFDLTYKGYYYPSPTRPIKNVIYRGKTEYCLQYYSQKLKSQTATMQLQNGYSTLFILPDAGTPYEYVFKYLSAETIDEIILNSECGRVSLSIPQLKIIDTTYNSRQNQILTNGNQTYYNENQARFSGIVQNDSKPVWLEAGYQRCVVVETYKQASPDSVSESVCKAPASGAKGPSIAMDCNRPFIFIIIKELTNDCKTGCKSYPIPVISGVIRNIVPGSQ